MNHLIGGSGSGLSAATLDGRVRVRRAIDAGNKGEKMRKNFHNNRRKTRAGINTGAVPPACTAEHRKTLSDGLRILARIIARTHLRQQAERSSAPAPGPPPAGESRH